MIPQLTRSNESFGQPEHPRPLPVPEVNVRPVELIRPMPIAEASRAYFQPRTPDRPSPADLVPELGYTDPGFMWRQAFAEADRMAAMQAVYQESPREQREGYATRKEVFHDLLGTVLDYVKSQDSYKLLESKSTGTAEQVASITEFDIQHVFQAYERGIRKAFKLMKPELNKPQRSDVESAIAHLDFSYKDYIANHLLVLAENPEAELAFDPCEVFMLVDTHARRIEYTTTSEAVNLVQHFGSRISKSVIQRDIKRAIPQHLTSVFQDEDMAQAA